MADGNLGNLVVKIDADVSALKAALANGQKQTSEFANGVNSSLKFIGDAFKLIFAEQVVSHLTDAFNKTVEYGVELEHLSRIANVSAGEIAKLQFAFQQQGGSTESLNRILPLLAKNMNEATDSGSKMAGNFRQLGVNVLDSTGHLKNVSDVFVEVADRVGKMQDKTKALALTMEILGRSGKDAFELFSQGGEKLKELEKRFSEFGFSAQEITKFAVDAKAYKDVWGEISEQFQLAEMVIVAKLLPAVTQLAKDLANFDWKGFATGVGEAASGLLAFFEVIAKYEGVIIQSVFTPLFRVSMVLDDLIKKFAFIQPLLNMASGGPMGAAASIAQNPRAAGGIINSMASGGPIGAFTAAVNAGSGQNQTGAGGATGAQGQGAAAAPAGGGQASSQGGTNPFTAALNSIDLLMKKMDEFGKKQQTVGEQFSKFWQSIAGNLINGFGTAFATIVEGGSSFKDAMASFATSIETAFLTAIGKMIAITIAWIAIATIAMLFGAKAPDFKTFFGAALKLSGGFREGGFMGGGFRAGGLMARNGLMTAQTGMALTGPFGEGGIPVVAHPNEVIAPIDKVFEMMQRGSMGGTQITINGYNQDPRALAQMVAIEVERKRRNPS